MINTKKTEYMSLNQSSTNKVRSSNEEDIKRVIYFKYLGIPLKLSFTHKKDIYVRLVESWSALNFMTKII